MLRFLFIFSFLGLGLVSQAQELSSSNSLNFEIPKNSIDASWIDSNYFDHQEFTFFRPPRTFSIPKAVFDQPMANQKEKINMLAIGKRAEIEVNRGSYSMKLPANEFQNKNSSIQIYGNQGFSNRTNNDFNFSRKTPDGGIRNEVYKDIRQPFINPYYRLYNRGYSRNYGRSSIYFTR